MHVGVEEHEEHLRPNCRKRPMGGRETTKNVQTFNTVDARRRCRDPLLLRKCVTEMPLSLRGFATFLTKLRKTVLTVSPLFSISRKSKKAPFLLFSPLSAGNPHQSRVSRSSICCKIRRARTSSVFLLCETLLDNFLPSLRMLPLCATILCTGRGVF